MKRVQASETDLIEQLPFCNSLSSHSGAVVFHS